MKRSGHSTRCLALLMATCAGVVFLPKTSVANPAVEEATRLLQDWQLEDALAAATRLLRETPDDPEVWQLVGRVQHQRGEHLSALTWLDGAREQGVSSGFLHELVAHSAAYGAQFQSLLTEHFDIRYLNKDEIVAYYARSVLEDAYRYIGGDLEYLPAERGERIVVEIYPDARGLAGATGLTIQEIATSGTIAVCKYHRLMITSPLATADGYSWADTLAHEFTHLVISKKSHNSVPIWLHEGIAKYYESRWKGSAGEALSSYSEKILAEAVRKKKYITYAQMHPSMAKLPSQKDAALAFAEVFTTIEFLLGRFGKGSVPKVLELAGDGLSIDNALVQVFKMNLKDIERAWQQYLTKRQFHIVPGAKPQKIRLADNAQAEQKEKPLETIEDRKVHDHARLGELLQLHGHHRAAIVEYEKAKDGSGLKYPTLLYRLARAYMESNDNKSALDILIKSLQVHPEYGDAHLLAGRIRFENKDFTGARQHFEAVRLQNPFNPEIHVALAALYAAEDKPEDAAIEQRFVELSRQPRPTRTYERPKPPAGNATLSIVPPVWKAVRLLPSQIIAAPVKDWPVAAGILNLEYTDLAGAQRVHEVRLEVGENKVVLLP
ncbi:MAG: tetratricopeptide repeat protein [Myxococcota bacterium]